MPGPPQITSEVVEVAGVMGQQVEVVAEFCSDPGPIRNTWAWDEVVLPSGNQYGGEHPGTVTVGADKNETLVFVHFSAQAASISISSVAIIKRRS